MFTNVVQTNAIRAGMANAFNMCENPTDSKADKQQFNRATIQQYIQYNKMGLLSFPIR